MPQSQSLSLLQRAYFVVNTGLWLFAAVAIAWLIINLPKLSEATARAAQQHTEEMARENRAYCEKWGMAAGTAQHSTCLRDLADMRSRDKDYILGEFDGLL